MFNKMVIPTGNGGGTEPSYKLHSILVKSGSNTYTVNDFTTIDKIKWSAEYKDGWNQYYAYGEATPTSIESSMTGYGITALNGNTFTFYWDSTDNYTCALAIFGS